MAVVSAIRVNAVAFDDINITATASGGFGINYGAAFGA